MNAAPRRYSSSAVPVAAAFVALVIYASLYPFSGWTWPFPEGWLARLRLPWPRWNGVFDVWANLLAYVPLGALFFVAAVRSSGSPGRAWALALLGPMLLSYLMELLQYTVPSRVPSRIDWLLNTAGGLVGAVLGWVSYRLGLVDRWHHWRERWFAGGGAAGLTLLWLWPVGLLFPTPVPLGLGHVLDRVRDQAVMLLLDTPWSFLIDSGALADDFAQEPLGALAEALAVALGLLAPCLLAYALARPGWRRVILAVGAATVGFAGSTLSTTLAFGPDHALAWLTPSTPPGLTLGLVVALALFWLPRRAAAGVGLVTVTALLFLVALAPQDPYFAESLQSWEQGRFIHFHGVAQWVGWLWPYAVLVYLLMRIGAREPSS